jgi:hypothetical protein
MKMDLATIVLLLVCGLAIHIAYTNPAMGNAILVGAGVLTLLQLMLQRSNKR